MAEMAIPVVKAKGQSIAVDLDKIPEQALREVYLQGLKAVLNRGMTKITTSGLVGDDLAKAQAAAMKKASENLEALYEDKIRITGGKKKLATGVVMTEARRIAKALIKEAIKASGKKASTIEAKELTRAANELIEEDASILEMAKKAIDERQAKSVSSTIVSSIKVSDKLLKKAEEKKKASKEVLSAAKAKLTAKERPQANA